MERVKKAVGLDIGKDAVKLVELEHQGEKVLLKKVDSASFKPAQNTTGPEQAQVIQQVITNLLAKNEIKQKNVILGINGQSVFVKFLEVLPVKTEKLAKTIQHEAQQQIPFSLDEVEWDAHVLDLRPKAQSTAYRVLLVAIKKDKLKGRMDLLEKTGLRPVVLDVGTLGIYNCIRFNQDYDENKLTCVIDMGHESSDLLILEGENFWMRSFAIGGDSLTQALEQRFNLGSAEAEKLKIRSNIDAPEIKEAVASVLEDLQGEITRSVEYYCFQQKQAPLDREASLTGQAQGQAQEDASEESTPLAPEAAPSVRIDEILLSGGTSLFSGLDKFLAERFSCQVRPLEPFKMLDCDEKMKAKLNLPDKVLFTQAVGLALRGIAKSYININLLKEQIKLRGLTQQRVAYGVGSALLALLILLGASTFMRQDYRGKSLRLRELKELLNTFSTYQPQIKEMQEREQLLAQQVESLRMLAVNRSLWLKVLDELQGMLPQGLWVTDFSGTICCDSVCEKELTNKLDLQGRATSYDDVNDFVSQLKASTLFFEVKPLSSAFIEEQAPAVEEEEKEKVEVVKFSVSMKVLPLD